MFLYLILIKINGSYATGVSLKGVCLSSLMAQEAESSALLLHASAVCFCKFTQRSVLTSKYFLTFRLALAMADALSFLGSLTCRASNISLAQ